MFHLFQE